MKTNNEFKGFLSKRRKNKDIGTSYPLRKKSPHSQLFWSTFFRIRAEYREIRNISPYSIQMRESAYQNNTEYEHFSRSDHWDKRRSQDPCKHLR